MKHLAYARKSGWSALVALLLIMALGPGAVAPATAVEGAGGPLAISTAPVPLAGSITVGTGSPASEDVLARVFAFIDQVQVEQSDTFAWGAPYSDDADAPRAWLLFTTQPNQALLDQIAAQPFTTLVAWGAPANSQQLIDMVGAISEAMSGLTNQGFSVLPEATPEGSAIRVGTALETDAALVDAAVATANDALVARGMSLAVGSVPVIVELGVWKGAESQMGGGYSSAGLRAACPANINRVKGPAKGRLARGATVVRLCPGRVLGESVQAPLDALTTKVNKLITLVNNAREFKDPICKADAGMERSFVFGYPGGKTVAVHWSLGGCELVEVGNRQVDAGPQLLAMFDTLLMAQRQARPLPKLKPAVPSCRVSGTTPRSQLRIGAKLRLRDGVLCSRNGKKWQRWPLTKRQLRFIKADFKPVTVAALPKCAPYPNNPVAGRSQAPQLRIVGRNIWGDRIILTTVKCGGFVIPEPRGSLANEAPGFRIWTPTRRTLQ